MSQDDTFVEIHHHPDQAELVAHRLSQLTADILEFIIIRTGHTDIKVVEVHGKYSIYCNMPKWGNHIYQGTKDEALRGFLQDICEATPIMSAEEFAAQAPPDDGVTVDDIMSELERRSPDQD